MLPPRKQSLLLGLVTFIISPICLAFYSFQSTFTHMITFDLSLKPLPDRKLEVKRIGSGTRLPGLEAYLCFYQLCYPKQVMLLFEPQL